MGKTHENPRAELGSAPDASRSLLTQMVRLIGNIAGGCVDVLFDDVTQKRFPPESKSSRPTVAEAKQARENDD